MTPSGWNDWLRGWLKRHPMQNPPEELQRDYRRQVMNRIQPQWVWVFRPRPVFGLAGALAAALAVAVVMVRVPGRTGPAVRQERIVLADAAAEEALELWNDLESLEQLPAAEPASGEADLEEELRQSDQSELAIS